MSVKQFTEDTVDAWENWSCYISPVITEISLITVKLQLNLGANQVDGGFFDLGTNVSVFPPPHRYPGYLAAFPVLPGTVDQSFL